MSIYRAIWPCCDVCCQHYQEAPYHDARTKSEVLKLMRRHGWSVVFTAAGRPQDRCPSCTRRNNLNSITDEPVFLTDPTLTTTVKQ